MESSRCNEPRYAFFGAALDPLDSPGKVALQHAYLEALERGIAGASDPADPYDLFRTELAGWLEDRGMRDAGRLHVPSWLTPRPRLQDRERIYSGAFADFLDRGGCTEAAGAVKDFVEESVFPDLPVMFGVDHSLTGGVIRALAERLGPDLLTVVVIDAHFDAIPTAVRRAIRMGQEGERGGPGGPELDEPYNCGNFLAHLLDDGVVLPERIFVLGAADLSTPALERSAGPGVRRYISAYRSYLDRGVRVIGRDEVDAPGGPERAAALIEEAGPGRVYISIDADVGARRAVLASRFLDLPGMDERALLGLATAFGRAIATGRIRLAGMDVMEVDVHTAGVRLRSGREDRTVPLLAEMIREIIG